MHVAVIFAHRIIIENILTDSPTFNLYFRHCLFFWGEFDGHFLPQQVPLLENIQYPAYHEGATAIISVYMRM